jgi:tRNA nucleotidyltransferase (CCA-adding enzyme)
MARRVLRAAYTAAAPQPVYAVGGYVRDLLLGLDPVDIDLVVEGDAIAVARRIGRSLNATVIPHPRFGTARVRLAGGRALDLATARSERYRKPAALPEVRPASLLEDLARRDFSINAMAARLGRHRFGPLIDPHGGAKDLRRGRIRVLHDGSFIDDPTRIFRAVRFEARYGFAIGRSTLRLIRAALDGRVMRNVAGPRILTEFLLIGVEPSVARIIKRLSALAVLAGVHRSLAPLPSAFGLLERVRRVLEERRSLPPLRSGAAKETYLLGMLYGLHPRSAAAVVRRLDPPRPLATKLVADLAAYRAASRQLALAVDLRQSRIARLLDPLSPEAGILVLATLVGGSTRKAVSRYLATSWRAVPLLGGEDLRRLGFRPGPIYREILAALRAARLDGQLRTRADEISFVRRRFPSASLEH